MQAQPQEVTETHASQLHISADTPMGATLIEGGATFRIWAPDARELYIITNDLQASTRPGWSPRSSDLLVRRNDDTWTGFVPDLTEGAAYRFYVVGEGSSGFKRDPWARELGTDPAFPDCNCLLRAAATYPWHDIGFQPIPFHKLIIYQLHVGTFYSADEQGRDHRATVAKFLDVALRVPYLRDLGVTAVQLLPIQEFPYDNSLGYNNVDFFSPEMAYQVEDPNEVQRYLRAINDMLAKSGFNPLTLEQLLPGPNQLKALVDLLHMAGISIIFDVVYNHGGGGFDDQSLYFFDRQQNRDNNNSLYFTDQGWAGGLIFAYWKSGVRDFLIRNAEFFLNEYHIDGFRYDEVSVIDNHGGWSFCQDLTNTLHFSKPSAIHIAEYWNPTRELAVIQPPAGMGFDAALADGLRDALRTVLHQASFGRDAAVDLAAVRDHLYIPYGFRDSWRAVNGLENHDIVYADRPADELKPRVPRLADPSNARSWYARSRTRFATSILMTASGIPMLFMGEEILEDKNWSDNPSHAQNTLIWWEGLETSPVMRDFLEFTQKLIELRRNFSALTGPDVNGFHVNDFSRVIAFHRWLEGSGDDVVIVGTLSETNLYDYEVGFPANGEWREVFNSDSFESSPDHQTVGNGGRIVAEGAPMHGFSTSARITIPANGVIAFASPRVNG